MKPQPETTPRAILSDGLLAGLLGYVTVIVVVGGWNLLGGRSPFHTAALFGSALFYGLTDPATLVMAPGPILAYNAAHLVVFLGLGMCASWIVALAERYLAALYLLFFLLGVVAFHGIAALGIFAQPLLGSGAPWQVGAGSLAATVVMGWSLWRRHPVLRRELREIPLGEVPGDPP